MAVDPLTVIAALRALLALSNTVAAALEGINAGRELTPEEQDAVTAARKLATRGLTDAIDEKLGGQ